jgi:hypothetical protein
MLLEAGAWLSKDYGEIRDLALERRDRDLQSLLLKYDVRNPHYYRLGDREKPEDERGDGRSLIKTSTTSVIKVVMQKLIILSTKSGSWRGHKGVEITRAALAAGAPPMILDLIRNALDPVSKLVDLLKATDRRNEQERERMGNVAERVEELGSDLEEDEVKLAQRRPSIQVISPDDDLAPSRKLKGGSHDSRPSSSGSVGSTRSYDKERRARSRPEFKRATSASASREQQVTHRSSSSLDAKAMRRTYPGEQLKDHHEVKHDTGTKAGSSSARDRPTDLHIRTSTDQLPPVIAPSLTRGPTSHSPKLDPPSPYSSSPQYLVSVLCPVGNSGLTVH